MGDAAHEPVKMKVEDEDVVTTVIWEVSHAGQASGGGDGGGGASR